MASHDSLYPLILAEATGCPLATVRTAMNRAAAAFCSASRAWTVALDPMFLRVGASEYELELPDGAQLVVITDARVGDRRLVPAQGGASQPGWGEESGEPTHFAHPQPTLLRLNRKPIEAATLSLTAALAPTLLAETLPDDIVNRYYEALTEGTKAILKRIPGQPWTDMAGAGIAQQLCNKLTAEARIERDSGFAVGSMTVTPRAFGA